MTRMSPPLRAFREHRGLTGPFLPLLADFFRTLRGLVALNRER
jgi:hypothetical protein